MATTNADITALLDNLVPEQEYADALRVHQRTIARQRQQGLPFVTLGGKVYIDARGAKRWVESRVVTRNQARTSRSVYAGVRS
jgi:hypothetical protein